MKKRVLAIILSAVLLLGGLASSQGTEVEAAITKPTGVRVYNEVEYSVFEKHIDAKTAPAKEGYAFAGWVAVRTDGTGAAIRTKEDAILSEDGVKISAKYIALKMTGVACQVKANTYDDGVTETELRVVSLVDDGVYQGFGFNLYKKVLLADGTYREDLICQYAADGSNKAQSTKRYTGMYVTENGEKVVKEPMDVFGLDAQDFYFTTVRIGGIPQRVYDSCIFVIKPYWVTADGTYVEGMGEYNRVSDGKNGIVNISVNLKNARALAAGRMDIDYLPEDYTFMGYDVGRVFEDMTVHTEDGLIKCIGLVADMNSNTANPNDIYINLRFTKQNTDLAPGESVFFVSGTEFSSKDEVLQLLAVSNVVY